MVSSILLTCILQAASGPSRDESTRSQVDMAAYQAARAQAGHDADAQVKLALWCEAHGLSAERIKHLTLATLLDPSNAAARGLLGLVAYQGKWRRPDEVGKQAAEDPAHKEVLREYLERRARTPDRAEDHWKLALWCDQNGLKPQAVAHFHRVVAIDPRRDAAWKRLGFKKQDGRWVRPDAAAAEKAELDLQTRANKQWKPRLEKWREALAGRDKVRRAAAEEALGQVTDPRAVPMVWMAFARGDEFQQRVAVRLLGQIDAPGASRGLALLAAFSSSAGIRRECREILRRRDPRDFAGLLIGFLREPVKYQVKPVDGPGSQGELFVEGKEANVRRLYVPLSLPTLLPGDQLGTDAAGMPIATRVLGSFWTPPMPVGGAAPGPARNPVDPNRVSQVLNAAGIPADQSKRLGQTIAANANPAAPAPPRGQAGVNTFVSEQIMETMQIPIGQMILEAQQSAAVAQQQLARDVQNIEAYNAPIVETNDRVRDLLKDLSGKDLGIDRDAWMGWLTDLQGYAYRASKTSPEMPPPTFVEQVPVDYQPQAVPSIASTVVNQQVTQIPISHSCFGAGTLVRTLDGPRPIEELRDGDLVLSQNTTTGALGYQPIVAVYHNPPNATYKIGLGKESIVATGIDRLWKAGQGWVMARDLRPGDRLRTLGGIAEITSIDTDRVQPVFNLQLAGGDNFFVGERAVLAHDNSLVNPTEKPFDAVPALGPHAGRSNP